MRFNCREKSWCSLCLKNNFTLGCLGGSVGWAADFRPGHDLAVCGFEPRTRLCAGSSKPEACFPFCVSISLCPSPACSLSLSNNKHLKKIFLSNFTQTEQENRDNKTHAVRTQSACKQSSQSARSEMKVGGAGSKMRDALELFTWFQVQTWHWNSSMLKDSKDVSTCKFKRWQ